MCLLAVIAAYVALWLLAPRATFLPAALNAILARIPHARGAAWFGLSALAVALLSTTTVAFMAIQVAIVYFFARLRLGFWQYLLTLVTSLAAIAGILTIAKLGLAAKIGHYYGFWKLPISLLVMLAAASVGCMVSLRVRDKNLLLPVVLLGAAIDCWTVLLGPVSSVLKHRPEVVSAVSAPIPQAAPAHLFRPRWSGRATFFSWLWSLPRLAGWE